MSVFRLKDEQGEPTVLRPGDTIAIHYQDGFTLIGFGRGHGILSIFVNGQEEGKDKIHFLDSLIEPVAESLLSIMLGAHGLKVRLISGGHVRTLFRVEGQ